MSLSAFIPTRLSAALLLGVVALVPRVAQAVPVHFVVDVPACTPHAAAVLLRSNRLDAATFRHDALTHVSARRWEGTFDVTTAPSAFRYKYTHAICDATACPGIEKALTFTGTGGEIADRALASGTTHTQDRVFIWRSALSNVDGAGIVTGLRPAASQVAFCAPYLAVSDVDGTITIGYDAYDGGDVTLEVGTTTAYGTRITHHGQYRNFFALHDLVPGALYHYRIVENGTPLPDQTFRAPPATGDALRFAFVGDTQYYGEDQHRDFAQIAERVAAFDPHLVLSPGDMVASEPGAGGPGGWIVPEMGRWNVFFDVASSLMARAPWMAAMGNHEEDGAFFWDGFAFPEPDAPRIDHYYFRAGNVHFTVLYTGTTGGYDMGGILDSQTRWMERVLADADADPSVRFKVILLHRGPLSEGTHHPTDGMAFWETERVPGLSWRTLWERYGVDLVLAGHNHNFTLAEQGGVRYVTSCGGAPTHEINATWRASTIYAEQICTADLLTARARTISFEARRGDDTVLDAASFTLCHDASDCAEAVSPCPEAARWSCVRRACAATCVAAAPDGGVAPVADAGMASSDAGDVLLDAGPSADLADAGENEMQDAAAMATDGGMASPDAAHGDDGGTTLRDAGRVRNDAGGRLGGDDSSDGCSCRVPSPAPVRSGGAPTLLALTFVLLARGRRRRDRTSAQPGPAR